MNDGYDQMMRLFQNILGRDNDIYAVYVNTSDFVLITTLIFDNN